MSQAVVFAHFYAAASNKFLESVHTDLLYSIPVDGVKTTMSYIYGSIWHMYEPIFFSAISQIG